MTPSRIIAACLLLISILMTSMLVYQHFVGAALLGCGPGSACAQAAGSVWGRVPGTTIPVSFVGLGYYIAVFAVYLISRGQIKSLIWLLRGGVVASLFFIGVMFANITEYLCWYCLIGHVAHIGFWGIVEYDLRQPTRPAPSPAFAKVVGPWFACFVLLSGGLVAVDKLQVVERARAAESDLAEAERQLAAGGDDDRGFVGRFVRGPADAPIRVVVFTGYQCPECKRFEDAFEPIFAEREDISLSIKHYPLNSACNRYLRGAMHENACRAAFAAEAAGLVGGSDGFWKMHDWLIHRGGQFTTRELREAIEEFGFNVDRFFAEKSGLDVRQRVAEDVAEAQAVGILGTPLIFINGVELRGWHLPDALPRAIAAASQRPGTPAADQPPSAFEKYIADWRYANEADLGTTTDARALGSASPRVVVDVWGDYLSNHVAEFDAALRTIMDERDDVRYRFRYFPMDRACNPHLGQSATQFGCVAASLAEAAARLNDGASYEAMHHWLFANRRGFTMERLPQLATDVGMDFNQLLTESQQPEVGQAIMRDISTAQELRIRQVPMIYVNNRLLPRWRLAGHDVLRTVIEEASKE